VPVLLIALLVAFSGSAVATHLVPTRLFLVKKPDAGGQKVVWKVREPDSSANVVGDPTADGATLRVQLMPGGHECFSMPPSGWTTLGTHGYRYRDAALANGPVEFAQIKKGRAGTLMLRVVVIDGGIVPGDPSTTWGANLTLGGGEDFCGGSAGGVSKPNDARTFRVAKDGAPATCVPSCELSSSTTSTTSTSTSSITATTAPGGVCCNGDGFFGLVSAIVPGDCGDIVRSGGTTDVACSGLYLGGGGNAVPLPMTPPDQTRAIFSITGCDGPRGMLGAATAAQTTSDRTCTDVGCFFGAPLPLPNSSATPVSVCALQVFTAPPTGAVDCTTGASNLDLPLAWVYHLTGDTAVDPSHTIPGIQPCPLCSSGTCIGGPNNGMSCTPGTTGISTAYPTSQDCPPDPMFNIGTLPIGLSLASGAVTWSGTPATNDTGATVSTQSRVFSGYCRDADESGNFEEPARKCWENAMAVGPPCSGIFESCEQRNNGAFGPSGGANSTIRVIGSAIDLIGGPAATTLAGLFSVPPSFNATVDAAADLPGPGAITMPGTASTCSDPTSCAATCLPFCASTTSTSVTSTSSTTTSSTTSTSSSSTTSTTTPAGTCCNGDGFLGFASANAPGDCGDLIPTFGGTTNIACSGLYIGGGGNAFALPLTPPDQTRSVFSIVGCDGPRGVVGATTSAETSTDRTCTSAGCFFGAPLPIQYSFDPQATASVCAVQIFAGPPTGAVDCTTGAGNLNLPLGWIYHLTSDASVDPAGTIPGVQPCPLCSSNTCIGGPNGGMPCTPGTTALGSAYPTSQDCPPDPMLAVGTLPIALRLSSGTVTWTGTAALNDTGSTLSAQNRVFSGFCRDVSVTGEFEQPPHQCWENGMAAGPACSGVFESCEQRNNGAFGPAGGANRTIRVIGNAMSLIGGPTAATLVGLFSIPPSYSVFDVSGDLPGPAALTMPGTASTCSTAASCP
jgi:hypothetical protein